MEEGRAARPCDKKRRAWSEKDRVSSCLLAGLRQCHSNLAASPGSPTVDEIDAMGAVKTCASDLAVCLQPSLSVSLPRSPSAAALQPVPVFSLRRRVMLALGYRDEL